MLTVTKYRLLPANCPQGGTLICMTAGPPTAVTAALVSSSELYIALVISNAAGGSIYCAQCSTAESPYCRRHPPSPSLCPADSRFCLIMEEYQPSHLGQ